MLTVSKKKLNYIFQNFRYIIKNIWTLFIILRLVFGSVFLSTNKVVQLKGTDIKLEQIGRNKTFPDNYVFHIDTKGKNFKCVIDFEKRKQVNFLNESKYIGYEAYNVPGQSDVNSTLGYSIMEFSYNLEGEHF